MQTSWIESAAPVPSLSSLRLGVMMLFFGLMLTLGVTLSLAAPTAPAADDGPVIAAVDRRSPSG